MKTYKAKIWLKTYFKTYVWIILPLCMYGNIITSSSYIEAGKHLTPYSVSVNGYYRSDGTYIRPHSRRPSGSVQRDAPYERKRIFLGTLFFLFIIGGLSSLVYCSFESSLVIKDYEQNLKNIEHRERVKKKEHEINEILLALTFDFSELINTPFKIQKGSYTKCYQCSEYISDNIFFLSYVPRSKRRYFCMKCALSSSFFTGSQSKYLDEIKFYKSYCSLLEEFQTKFSNKLESSKYKFTGHEMKGIFDSEMRKKQQGESSLLHKNHNTEKL